MSEDSVPYYDSLRSMVNGRTMGDDAPDGCDGFDFSLTVDWE